MDQNVFDRFRMRACGEVRDKENYCIGNEIAPIIFLG